MNFGLEVVPLSNSWKQTLVYINLTKCFFLIFVEKMVLVPVYLSKYMSISKGIQKKYDLLINLKTEYISSYHH